MACDPLPHPSPPPFSSLPQRLSSLLPPLLPTLSPLIIVSHALRAGSCLDSPSLPPFPLLSSPTTPPASPSHSLPPSSLPTFPAGRAASTCLRLHSSSHCVSWVQVLGMDPSRGDNRSLPNDEYSPHGQHQPSVAQRCSPPRRASPRLVHHATESTCEQTTVRIERECGQTLLVNMFGRKQSTGSSKSRGEASTSAAPAPVAAPVPAASEPELAQHERQRQVKRKAPAGPRGRKKGAGRVTKETNIPLCERVKQFDEHGLKVSAGKLFCVPCKEELPNLKESIRRHIQSVKHRSKFKKLAERAVSNQDLHDDLAVYFEENKDQHGVQSFIHLACVH